MLVAVLLATLLLQIGCLIALGDLIRITGKWLAWCAFGLGIIVSARRTVAPLIALATGGEEYVQPLFTAVLALLVFGLVFCSLWLIRPIFCEAMRNTSELEENRRRLDTLLSNLPGVVYRCRNDHDWTMEIISDGCRALTGYEPEEFLMNKRITFTDITDERDRESVWNSVQQSIARRAPFQLLYRIRTRSGEEKWVWEQGRAVYAPDGELAALEGFITDVTAQREANEALRQSEARTRIVVEQMPALLWTVDTDLRLESSLGAGLKALGIEPNQHSGMTLWEYFQTSDPECRPIAMHRKALGGEAVSYETEWAENIYQSFLEPRRDEEGKVTGVIGVALDVTEHRRADRNLRQVEARFRAAFDNAPIGMALIGKQASYVQVNRRFCDMVGFTHDELIGKPCDSLAHPEDVILCRELFEKFLAGDIPEVSFRKRYLHRDGRIIWTNVCGAVLRDEDGEPSHFITHITDITKSLQAEEALSESEQRFRNAFEHAPIGIALVGTDGRFLRVNGKLCEMLGFTADELAAMKYLDRSHPEDREKCARRLASLLAGETSIIEMPKCLIHKNGQEVWVDLNVSPVRDEDGEIIHFVAQMKDITEQRMAGEKLRESEEKYRTLTEAAQEVIFVVNREDKVEFVNTFAAQQFGRTPEQVIGKTRTSLFPPEVAARHKLGLDHVFETGEPFKAESESVFPTGKRWLHTQLSALRDGSGRVRAVMGVSRDLTDRKKSELALQRSEEFNRMVIESMPGGVVHVDVNGRIKKSNAEAARLLGLTEQQLTSLTVDDFGPVTIWEDGTPCPPEEYPEMKAIRTGLAQPPVTIGVRKPDGQVTWASYSALPTRDPQTGELTGAVCTFLDITEVKRAEALRKERDAAAAANRAKSTLLANVSHEVRTPLMSVLGAAELLQHRGEGNGESHRHVDIILRNGRHLLDLVNDLLDAARMEAGKLAVHVRECSLVELIADVQAVTSTLHVRPQVEFGFRYLTPVPVSIETDPLRLKQAMINLISNALKFTTQGHVLVKVSVDPQADEPRLTISVEDTGCGIRESDLGRIFEAFSQVEPRQGRIASGTGLGLAISRQIAMQLGGSLEVFSEENRGSQFVLRVATGSLDHVDWESPGSNMIAERIENGLDYVSVLPNACGNVLLAEDDPDVRSLMVDALTSIGATVVAVDNGKDAVELVMHRQFDLVILDIRMPVMSGLKAVKIMRERGYRSPIVGMTASASSTDASLALDADFDAFWPKPISLDKFAEFAAAFLPDRQVETTCSQPNEAVLPIADRERFVSMTPLFASPSVGAMTQERDRSDSTRPSRTNSVDGAPTSVLRTTRFRDAIAAYQRALPEKLERITRAIHESRIDDAREILHQMVGSAGIHEFHDVSRQAAQLLQSVKQGNVGSDGQCLNGLRQAVENALV